MAKPNHKWLTISEAAESLGVSVRTITGWLRFAAKRNALGAVRNGEQWRIPRPENIYFWETEARERLAALGIKLGHSWEQKLERIGQQNDKYKLESDRLFLALWLQAYKQRAVSSRRRTNILDIWQEAFSALHSAFGNMRVRPSRKQQERCLDNFKVKLSPELLSCWPDDAIFESVRKARTLKALEGIREHLDFVLSVRDAEQNGQKPTAKNVCPLLHKDIMQQLNDTREKLQVAFVEMREPQNGLPLRTFRNRYPVKGARQKGVVAQIYGIRDALPGAEERQDTAKTPVRGSSQDGRSH